MDIASQPAEHADTDAHAQQSKYRVRAGDGALLECLRAGGNWCYEKLVRGLGPGVLSTARRYLRSDAEAADCFQDTFIAVFEGIHRFEQRSSIATWVRRIAINQCMMRIRARKRRREDSIDHLLPEFDGHGARIGHHELQVDSTTMQSLDRAQTKRLVRDKIESLPESYRVMLLLRDIDGYSTKEAAAVLGISIVAAKTRLHRARAALRTLLEPVMEHLDYDADM